MRAAIIALAVAMLPALAAAITVKDRGGPAFAAAATVFFTSLVAEVVLLVLYGLFGVGAS